MAIIRKLRSGIQELNRIIYLRRLLKSRYLPRKKLKRIQLKKFKKLLIHAYKNVPFYHEKYTKAGINPYDIKTEKDILKIPILTKSEIKDNFPDKILAKGTDIKKCVIDTTSGTTHTPLKYIISLRNQPIRDAIHNYIWEIVGCSKKSTLIFISINVKKLNILYGKKKRFKMSPFSDLKFQLQTFDRTKPDFLYGTPSVLYALALQLKKSNYFFKKSLKGIILTGETFSTMAEETIKKVFNTNIFESYGSGETVDAACECRAHKGMHEIMEHNYVEIIKDNRPADEMEAGNVLITDFDNYDMPFIRYDVGDVARRSYDVCGCGITGPLIKNIEGRKHDFLVSTDGKLITPFAFTGHFSPFSKEPLISIIEQFQIVQDKKKDIVINIVAKDKISKAVRSNLINFMKKQLGKVNVSVKLLKKIPLEKSGKFRIVKSKVRS